MPLSPRDRVLTAINHEEPDRIPLVIGVSNATGIKMRTYQAIKAIAGIDAPDNYIYDWPELGTAEIDEQTMQRLHSDVLGAFLLHVLFEGDPIRARGIAEGWRADRVQLWGKDDEVVVCGVFLFDAPKAATQFDLALAEQPGRNWSTKRAGRIVAICRGADNVEPILEALAATRIGALFHTDWESRANHIGHSSRQIA